MIEYIDAKSILSPLKNGPDPYFGVSYNMNLYRGCQHQCIYCDTRSKIYGIGDLSHIRIKQNAIELLEQKLYKLRKKGTISTGSMNDPYMPIERKTELTRKALGIIAKYNFPIHIITKSNLVLRDIDLLHEIKKTYAAVSFSITSTDDSISKILEPGAPPTSDRLKTMQALNQMGIYTGVILTPVLPYITDTNENISGIINATAKAGGKYVLAWMGLTQREGQREYFHRELDKYFPGIKEKYLKSFGNNYNCSSENAETLYETYRDLCQIYSINTRMDFYKPNNPVQLDLF